MAKFHGIVGYAETIETSPGVWTEQITDREHFGDLIRNTRRLQSPDSVNSNVNISNEISIVSDPYSNKNFHSMRYVEFMGVKWTIENVEVQYPRLILTLGGVYNGE